MKLFLLRPLAPWILFLLGTLFVWDSVLRYDLVSPAALAYPSEVLLAMPTIFGPKTTDMLTTGYRLDVWSTIRMSLAAFFASVPIGVSAGFLIFYAGRAGAPARLAVDFLRSVPATALVPVFIILVGLNESTKLIIGSFSSSLIIVLSTFVGLQGRNITRVGTAKLYGLRGLRRILLLDLPEAAPQIFLGLRAGISLALVLVVVSEMFVGSNNGLGKVIYDMQFTDRKDVMYAALIVTGIIGYVYNVGLIAIERRVLHWRGH